jgi:hypothetical protein
MKRLQLAGVILFSALLVAFMASPVRADGLDKMTFVTFSAPVEIPGFHGPRILPAGTYTFKLLDSQSNRHIVQIYDKDQQHLYATVLAINNYRMRPTGHTVIRFTENADGSPDAIKAWFYPGDNFGQEFVYPKTRALELAKYTNEPVPSMAEDTTSTTEEPAATATVTTEAPTGEETPYADSQPDATPATTATPAPATTPNTTPDATPDTTPANSDLPQTASDLPLILLCGSTLIGLAIGLRLLARAF